MPQPTIKVGRQSGNTWSGRTYAVHYEGRERGGYVDLHLGQPGGEFIECVHAVPLAWWRSPSDQSVVTVGGYTYRKPSKGA